MSCLPSSSPSIHYSSLSIFRARAMCVLGIGVELPSAHCASRLATCAPLPPSQCRGIHLWSADLVSVWTEGAVLCSNRSLLLSPRRLPVPMLHGSSRM